MACLLAQAVELSNEFFLERRAAGKSALIPANKLAQRVLEGVAVDDALGPVNHPSIRRFCPDFPTALSPSLVKEAASDLGVELPSEALIGELLSEWGPVAKKA